MISITLIVIGLKPSQSHMFGQSHGVYDLDCLSYCILLFFSLSFASNFVCLLLTSLYQSSD